MGSSFIFDGKVLVTGAPKACIGLHRATRHAQVAEGVVVGEFGEVLHEFHLDRVQGAVTVLGQNQLAQARCVNPVWVLCDAVILGAVDEGHNVRVLLNGPGLTQVRQQRPLVPSPGFHVPAQLRQRNDGHVKLLGNALDRPRNA